MSFASATESTEVEMGGAGSDGVTLVAVFVGAVVEMELAGDVKASESICKKDGWRWRWQILCRVWLSNLPQRVHAKRRG